MLTVSRLCFLPHPLNLLQNPDSPLIFQKRFSGFRFQNTKRFYFFSLKKPPMPPRPPPPPHIVAEYAKSDRSSCKKCAKAIVKKALRVGIVSRDARGFDMTKWHHLDCFPVGAATVCSTEAIKGFEALQSSDQEALKKSLVRCDDSVGKGEVHKGDDDDDEENELKERDAKKAKLSTSDGEANLDIAFSVSSVKNMYKDATLQPKWKAFNTIIYLEQDDGLHNSNKIAAFDFDGTLAKTSVKRVGADAWSLMYPSVPDKLQCLYNDGYKLVIFTNESNIERWKKKRQVAVDSKIGRLNNFINQVKVPMQVFIACGLGESSGQAADAFRKPKPGMWHIMEKHFNSGISIDMNQLFLPSLCLFAWFWFPVFSTRTNSPNYLLHFSVEYSWMPVFVMFKRDLYCRSFYVGDAAGRLNDHSDADIKFAQAVGLKFYVPEEYFVA